jgi:hypothetical protein
LKRRGATFAANSAIVASLRSASNATLAFNPASSRRLVFLLIRLLLLIILEQTPP